MTIDWWIEAIEYSLTTADLSSFVLSDRVQKHLAAPPAEILMTGRLTFMAKFIRLESRSLFERL